MLGELHFSTIAFYADIGKLDAVVIPVGVMAEIYLPQRLYALGLIARTELSNEELRFASELAKPLITRPFKYLAEQFEKAWETLALGAALKHLAATHAHSALHFSVPERLPFYLTAGESVLRAHIRMQIGTLLDDQMSQLLEHGQSSPVVEPQPRTKPQEELLQLTAA
jgi:hypothetical protein